MNLPEDLQKIIKEAAWVVVMYDQANTNKVVANLGSRGKLLDGAIEDLRKALGGDDKIRDLTLPDSEWVER